MLCSVDAARYANSDLFRVAAVQGRAAIFNDCKSLKMKQNKNDIFCFACSDNSGLN
jgi:hypothetical protein